VMGGSWLRAWQPLSGGCPTMLCLRSAAVDAVGPVHPHLEAVSSVRGSRYRSGRRGDRCRPARPRVPVGRASGRHGGPEGRRDRRGWSSWSLHTGRCWSSGRASAGCSDTK
jgi:hypothetical protein